VRGYEIYIAVIQPGGRPCKPRTLVERLQQPGPCWRSRPISDYRDPEFSAPKRPVA